MIQSDGTEPVLDDEVPSLTFELRKTELAVERQHILAERITLQVHGPLLTSRD
jgi:hypothetical protein